MINDKIYYNVGVGLVSLVVIYVLIRLFNLHIRVNKSFMEKMSFPTNNINVLEGFIDKKSKDGEETEEETEDESDNPIEKEHKKLKKKIKQLTKSIDSMGTDEIEDYLLDLDEYVDLSTIDGMVNPGSEHKNNIYISSYYKKAIENSIKYLNSGNNKMGKSKKSSDSLF